MRKKYWVRLMATCAFVTGFVTPTFALVGEGVSGSGILETIAPSTGSITVSAETELLPLEVSFSGVSDADHALAFVELWFRKDDGSWLWSGLSSSNSSGAFQFTPPGVAPDYYGTYYFELVTQDSIGNRSTSPSGNASFGQGSTSFDVTASITEWWVLE